MSDLTRSRPENGQSLEQLALRVLLPAFPGTTLARDVAGLFAEGLGGVCLFGSNTADGPAAVAELTSAIHAAAPYAVVAVDEEGGDVTRLHALDRSPVLGPAALGAAGDLALTRETGAAIGTELAAAGIDLDLGPVADVNSDPDNPVIGTRSFGTDAAAAAAHTAAWVAGLQGAGVAACAKHFPGHGDTAQDSHLALPMVDVDLPTLLGRELAPFAAAVEAGVASVMTSHILVPAVDPALPATLSRPVLGLLRDHLGYGGVLVTDALDMAGASAGRGIPEAAVLSLAAGADLLCLGADKDIALVRQVQAAIVAAVRSGRLAEERLVEAVDRIARLPRGAGSAAPVDAARQLAGARRAVTVEGELPDLRGAEVVSVATPANIAIGEVPWGLPPDRFLQPGEPVTGDRPVVLQVRDAHRRPEVLVEGAAVVVEWGWPGPYAGGTPRICTRGYSRPGAVAVTELLRKAGWDR
ncbi:MULTISPECIES: glycoside hydrolase family 3 N-terminal domain-containing protein [unclassified Nocardioides]|uniref:glycoside hydrolase family 3 N-terminal domain-containing protein n=1 Tax=unclassified Nocardioides TaxID=2615069 RepID=UPI00005700A5|nr:MULTISPECIES: glycoside hydrolase family 3 N-terminal domain-containing protein [unclassified Nocardioides]ABL83983.1 glycoside hydrolase, family 3 domain protein [Nocardioides sp. JS614]